MSFKENILKKININRLAKTVIGTIKPLESGIRIDKTSMRCLLESGQYEYQKERDLDLYILGNDGEKSLILVLDNELPIYHTKVEDVVLRRSPIVKEMISFKNIIKILNDSDVIVSKRKESIEFVQKDSVGKLDLSYSEKDILGIESEGVAALNKKDAKNVLESLELFAELLDYRSPPKILRINDYEVLCAYEERTNGELLYGPIAMYNRFTNTIRLVDDQIKSTDPDRLEYVHQVAKGTEKPSIEGSSVYTFLKEEVLKSI